MTSLVSPAQARALIPTSLLDENLQTIIDRVEDQIVERIGLPQDDNHTVEIEKTMRGEGGDLFLPTEIYAVVSIEEDGTTLAVDDYQVWSGGVIERLPIGAHWGSRCVVTYQPADDRKKREQVIIDLVRLVIQRTAMKYESVGGEYSYTAPSDWDDQFNKMMKRLTFQAV